jgi:hypothetical protein
MKIPMRKIPLLSKPLTAGLAAVLVLSGTVAGAFAADLHTDPIQIDHVRITCESLSADDASRLPVATQISFTNKYSAPASDVVFLLESAGYVVDRFDDVGSFAPGVTVRHTFPESQLGSDFSVVVAAATFDDGTKWQNSAVAVVPPAAEPIAGACPRG